MRARRMGRLLPGLLMAALLAVLIAACAPSSGGDGGTGMGVDAGDVAPPFAMQLTDGSEVALRNLVEGERPAFMMYFATW